MRYRVTLRHNQVELRGYIDGDKTLTGLAEAVEPLGVVVIASPVNDSYNPWEEVGSLRDWQNDMLAWIRNTPLSWPTSETEALDDLLRRAGVDV